jgi:selenocysteine lyase/cysteine desulfurase
MLAGVTAAVDVLADLIPGGNAPRRERLLVSMRALEAYEEELHQHMRSGLEALGKITFYSQARHRTPTELFAVDGIASQAASEHLAGLGVYAPAGSFYAIEAADHLGIGERGAIRAGLAPYSTYEDVDRLIAGVAEVLP